MLTLAIVKPRFLAIGPRAAAVLALGVLALAVGCGPLPRDADPGARREAIATEAASLAPGVVPVEALAPIGEVWDVLRRDFVEPDAMNGDRLSAGAVQAMLDAIGDPALRFPSAFPPNTLPIPDELPDALAPLWDAWVGLFQGFNTPERPLDSIELSRAAIRGLIDALDDPHTAYIPPDRYEIDAPDFAGNYEGIGSEIYRRGGQFILSPMRGSPATKSGLRAGDILLAVDGESVEGWTILEAVSHIRGLRGTMVSLEVLHLGEETPLVLEIERGTIKLESVTGNMTNDGIAYIRLSAFYGNSTSALVARLEEVQEQSARGVTLDLRDNAGGLLSTSVEVASQFLGDGLVVYQSEGKGKRTDFVADDGGVALDIPLVVLVNQFSASGSELVAGALQDRDRAVLVGVRTFGKGSVNRLRPLSDGGGLYYSFARWYTPNGRLIEGYGLEPDIVVAGTAAGRGDQQLDRALEVLRQEIAENVG